MRIRSWIKPRAEFSHGTESSHTEMTVWMPFSCRNRNEQADSRLVTQDSVSVCVKVRSRKTLLTYQSKDHR
jgi:hypothetical protein